MSIKVYVKTAPKFWCCSEILPSGRERLCELEPLLEIVQGSIIYWNKFLAGNWETKVLSFSKLFNLT